MKPINVFSIMLIMTAGCDYNKEDALSHLKLLLRKCTNLLKE